MCAMARRPKLCLRRIAGKEDRLQLCKRKSFISVAKKEAKADAAAHPDARSRTGKYILSKTRSKRNLVYLGALEAAGYELPGIIPDPLFLFGPPLAPGSSKSGLELSSTSLVLGGTGLRGMAVMP